MFGRSQRMSCALWSEGSGRVEVLWAGVTKNVVGDQRGGYAVFHALGALGGHHDDPFAISLL